MEYRQYLCYGFSHNVVMETTFAANLVKSGLMLLLIA